MVWHNAETDDVPDAVEAFVDSEWAACLSTRKSTSGGVLAGHEVMDGAAHSEVWRRL